MNLLTCILLVTISVGFTFSSTCPDSKPTSVHLKFGSRRNQTGFWLLSVDAYRETPMSSPNDQKGLQIDMEHGTQYNQGAESQHLKMNVAVTGAGPPADYKPVAGLGYYKTHFVPLSWVEARDKCQEEGTHLLILNSIKEFAVVQEFFANKYEITGATQKPYIHVGVHDRYKEGQYQDVLGEPVKTAGNPLWHPGQPSGGSAENCVVANTIGTYSDAPCAWKEAFICEFNGTTVC